jgi:hypothetical protein
MSELSMLALPEQIAEDGSYVIATYYLETSVETEIVSKISAIAVEQTTGTWVPVPEETPEMREKHVAKVVFPWSTWAIMAKFLILSCVICFIYYTSLSSMVSIYYFFSSRTMSAF